MSNATPPDGTEDTQVPQENQFEPPAIVALGKLDEVTFGAPFYLPSEGATSYI